MPVNSLNHETAILVVSLVAPIVGVLVLGYFAAQGSARARSVLRWATVPVYVGAAIVGVGSLASDRTEVWSASGIVILFCSFAASGCSRALRHRLGLRRSLVVRRGAYAGQAIGAWLCAVQAAVYGSATGTFLAIVALSAGILWLWMTTQLTRVIAAQATIQVRPPH